MLPLPYCWWETVPRSSPPPCTGIPHFRYRFSFSSMLRAGPFALNIACCRFCPRGSRTGWNECSFLWWYLPVWCVIECLAHEIGPQNRLLSCRLCAWANSFSSVLHWMSSCPVWRELISFWLSRSRSVVYYRALIARRRCRLLWYL